MIPDSPKLKKMDKAFLKTVGRFWSARDLPENTVRMNEINEIVSSVKSYLNRSKPKSVLITGERGVGKSGVINLVASEFHNLKWPVFIATAGNLIAGQRYIGDVEKNTQLVLEQLSGVEHSLWIIPRFYDLYHAGLHEYSTSSTLDYILPYAETGKVRIIGEIDPRSFEKLARFKPEIMNVFDIIKIEASSKEFTLKFAGEWMKKDRTRSIWSGITAGELQETYNLARHYFSFKENPGGLIDLLKHAKSTLESESSKYKQVTPEVIIESLVRLTGLPRAILDDREKLKLDELRSFFSNRVIGQEEAVNTLVERIAMIKAGLTDPTRPYGVFLFAGPTGTGKTEIAKALAEFLFSSENKLVRLDMSEYQTHESTVKIFGESHERTDHTSLVGMIRENPFSVVLLDEFEKAHPRIWDIFLQVFDDGRLTDQRGETADFRHSIIILTSNAGAGKPVIAQVGFNPVKMEQTDNPIQKAIFQTFRPEFVNRLDKIVIFNPLSKSVIKKILRNELKKILTRRGLRQKQWALEIDDSALDFLMDKGYSGELGARPMKRAIEQHLLAPLAITIVNHSFPEGDQFLFVSKGKEGLAVDFVDPDEPDISWAEKQEIIRNQKEKAKTIDFGEIIYKPKGILAEFELLRKEKEKLDSAVQEMELAERKEELMSEMSSRGFWESEERYDVLAETEFLDRFLATLESTGNLFERISDTEKIRVTYDPKLVKKLAERIYLLQNALIAYENDNPQDAYIKVIYEPASADYGEKLVRMYTEWCRKRGMEHSVFTGITDRPENSIIIAVSGFGAHEILKCESGIHLFEVVETKQKTMQKITVHVHIIPRPTGDYRMEVNEAMLDKRYNEAEHTGIVRRYRFSSSPVIKDNKRGWQTGKLDRVFGGDFDLI